MEIFIIVFAVFLVSCLLMSLSIIYSNRPLKGSCGGLSNITGEKCSICGASSEKDCDRPTTSKKVTAQECNIQA